MTRRKNDEANLLEKTKRELRESTEKRDRMTAQRKALMEEYAAVSARQWDENAEICPTCHQPLPPEQVEELRAAFNEKKSAEKEDINRRGQACRQAEIETLNEKIESLVEDALASEEIVKKTTEQISKLNASIGTPPPFEETEEYKERMLKP